MFDIKFYQIFNKYIRAYFTIKNRIAKKKLYLYNY